MHHIALFTERSPSGGDTFDVYWTTGANTKGICRCTVTAPLATDKEVAAELYALQHLLEVENVLGHDRAGNSLTITVSSGAVKKLALFKSDKDHLIPWTFFLTTRFGDATIEVDKPRRNDPKCWLPAPDKAKLISLTAAGPLPETIYLHGVGQVELTVHAIERFLERRAAENRATAWRQLRNMAKDTSVRQIQLPPQVHAEKMEKWGKAARDYYNRGTGWHFVISDDPALPHLLTVFEKEIKNPTLVAEPAKQLPFAGKIAVVSDIDNPIGADLVRSFQKQGAQVVFSAASDEEAATRLVNELNAQRAGSVVAYKLEVSKSRDARELVQKAMQLHGRIDCVAVVTIAPEPVTFSRVNDVMFHHAFSNLRTPIFLVQAAFPEMKKSGGSIVLAQVQCDAGGQPDLLGSMTGAAFQAIVDTAKQEAGPNIHVAGVSSPPCSELIAAVLQYSQTTEPAANTA